MQDLMLAPGAMWAMPIIEMREIKNKELLPIVNNFKNNFANTHALATLLSNLIVPTMVVERAMQPFVKSYVGGQIVLHPEADTRQLENYVNNSLKTHFADHPKSFQEPPSETYVNMRDQAYAKIQMIADINPVTRKAIDSWFFAQITGIWTAFEVLAQELWHGALQCSESNLSYKVDQAIKEGVLNGDRVTVLIEKLRLFRVKVNSRQRFSSLGGIRAAYKFGFDKNGEDINKSIADNSFLALAKLRNLIVHTGGLFDKDYLESIKEIPYAPKGAINTNLSMNAGDVYNLLHPAAIQCRDLVYAVDDWLIK